MSGMEPTTFFLQTASRGIIPTTIENGCPFVRFDAIRICPAPHRPGYVIVELLREGNAIMRSKAMYHDFGGQLIVDGLSCKVETGLHPADLIGLEHLTINYSDATPKQSAFEFINGNAEAMAQAREALKFSVTIADAAYDFSERLTQKNIVHGYSRQELADALMTINRTNNPKKGN